MFRDIQYHNIQWQIGLCFHIFATYDRNTFLHSCIFS